MNVKYHLSKLIGISLAAPLCMSEVSEATPPSVMSGLESEAQSSQPSPTYTLFEENQGASIFTQFTVSSEVNWTNKDERDFVALARKEALGTATTEEMTHLESMSRRRDIQKVKLSADQILYRRRLAATESSLLSTLKNYFSLRDHGQQS